MTKGPQAVNPTLGLRHAVLWVRDPEASVRFYEQALGLEVTKAGDGHAFLSSSNSATDHDLALFRAPVDEQPDARQIGLYHLAWEVATLAELVAAQARLRELGALVGENNHGVSRSLYAQDPDGIEFEVMWEVPEELYDDSDPANVALDLDADIARFGADTAGRGGR